MRVREFTFERNPEELKRILITQFYENAVLRYGPDSEQALALLKFLSPIDDIEPRTARWRLV